MSRKHEKLQTLLQPVVEQMGFVFWGLEYLQGRGAVLRIFIDHENGITVDDCAAVSHQASGVLDVEDPITGEYSLEVSSPGLDRPFFSLDQLRDYLGDRVQVRLLSPHAGRRRFTALLSGADGENLTLEHEQEPLVIPFAQVDKINLVPRID